MIGLPFPRRVAAQSAVLALAVLTVVGCTGNDNETSGDSPNGSPSATQSPSVESSRAEYIEGETVTEAPKTVNGLPPLLSIASQNGNATLPLKQGTGAGPVGIQVNCQGKGTLEVALVPANLSFALTCVDSEVSSTYNEVNLKRSRADASIRITAPSTVRWAVTVEQ